MVVGRQATALVVSCDTAETSPLAQFLNLLQSSETPHPIDAGSTVTCLVHGQELADPLKPALVHEDRPIADSCLGGYSSSGSHRRDD